MVPRLPLLDAEQGPLLVQGEQRLGGDLPTNPYPHPYPHPHLTLVSPHPHCHPHPHLTVILTLTLILTLTFTLTLTRTVIVTLTLAPLQLVWCGTDSVILYWDKLLLMVRCDVMRW